MKLVIADNRIDKKCETALESRGFELVKLPSFPCLQEPVSAHPDMLLFIDKGRIFCHKDYYSSASAELEKLAREAGLNVAVTEDDVGAEYPLDVIFNAAQVGERLICRRDTLSDSILSLYPENMIISVKQGYAKCSVCVVSDNAIITADRSIAPAADKCGIDVLLVSPDGVRLDGYDCGFIGGASGNDGENVYFCGDLDLHPDGKRIKDFCRYHGRGAVSLSDEPIYDYGTLIFL